MVTTRFIVENLSKVRAIDTVDNSSLRHSVRISWCATAREGPNRPEHDIVEHDHRARCLLEDYT